MSSFEEKAYGAGGGALLTSVMSYNALNFTLEASAMTAVAGAFVGFQALSTFTDAKVGNKRTSCLFSEASSFLNYQRLTHDSVRYSSQSKVFANLSHKKSDNRFYINNFKYSQQVKDHLSLFSSFFVKSVEKKDLTLKWDDLKKGSLIVGSMGTGKTVFLNNIITQYADTRRKMIFHDTKGEFTSYFYREDKDFIINHLDERGCYWNFFEDNKKGISMSLINQFFSAYFTAVAGESGDKFWQEMASKRFREIFEKLKIKKDIKSSEKMKMLAVELQEYFDAVSKKQDKTEQSIATTLEIASDIFFQFAFMSENNKKSISIVDFFKSKDSRLFLHTIEAVAKDITPFLSAFLTIMMSYQLTYFEKCEEEDYVLYVLDEYLTFYQKMSEDLRKSVHTKARSFGMLLLPALQYLPSSDDDAKILLSSVENLFVFSITDPTTLQKINEVVGKARYTSVSQKNKRDFENSEFSETEIELLDNNIIKNLKVGEHMTYIAKKSILYKAHVKYTNTEEINDTFEQVSAKSENEFIAFKEELVKKAEANRVKNELFADTKANQVKDSEEDEEVFVAVSDEELDDFDS